jgi:hypothetical protein
MRTRLLALVAGTATMALAAPAAATPVCTDGYKGGPPMAECGGRIFPEAANAQAYIQYHANPLGFEEFRHGLEFLAQKYPRWVSVTTLDQIYNDPKAVSAGPDGIRPHEQGDTGDGKQIFVLKITDHQVADKDKKPLFFSLSVHGNERGGLEGGARTAEDLAMAAEAGGKIVDGVANYENSATGREPKFNEYEVKDVLAKEVVYMTSFNVDGWSVGDWWAQPPLPYERGNSLGTDLNRQMPTVGRINTSRNPLEESEMKHGTRFMHDIAAAAPGGKMAYGADIHGELTSQAYMDIMYPAGEFDSVDHRRLMAIAERTKSYIDATLYQGIIDEAENASTGNEDEAAQNAVPTRPAHWATVWDTLGYTDTGFIGDYLAQPLSVTGMDYEIAFNHTVPDKTWNVYLQENHINASRGIIKTAMAYALFQEEEFSAKNVVIDPKGRPGYVIDPDTVSDKDENGPGTLPGPGGDGKSANGEAVAQASYNVTNQKWFKDTSRLMPKPFLGLSSGDIAESGSFLDFVDTLVLADNKMPADVQGRPVDAKKYWENIREWVGRGGNLVLTDRALHGLADLGIVAAGAVKDITVYQPYANMKDFSHPLLTGLRPNARQLVEAPVLGYEIGNDASPMTVVDLAAWEAAGGKTVATTGNNSGSSTPASDTVTSIGELKVKEGFIRVVGGALPTPTETNDHRYGLKSYAMTYTGLYIMENAIKNDAPGLGNAEPPSTTPIGPAKSSCVRRAKKVRLLIRGKKGAMKSAKAKLGSKQVKVLKKKGKFYVVVNTAKIKGSKLKVVIDVKPKKGKPYKVIKTGKLCARKK